MQRNIGRRLIKAVGVLAPLVVIPSLLLFLLLLVYFPDLTKFLGLSSVRGAYIELVRPIIFKPILELGLPLPWESVGGDIIALWVACLLTVNLMLFLEGEAWLWRHIRVSSCAKYAGIRCGICVLPRFLIACLVSPLVVLFAVGWSFLTAQVWTSHFFVTINGGAARKAIYWVVIAVVAIAVLANTVSRLFL